MNYSTYRFTLDIHKTKSQVSIPVLYGDTGIQFFITLTDGGKPYFIEDGCRAVFSAKKPDGTALFNDCLIEANTRILYQFTTQTTNVEGMMNCELRLYGTDGKLITTPCFVVVVDPRVAYDDDVIDSETESSTIDSVLKTEVARAAAEAARVEAEVLRAEAEEERKKTFAVEVEKAKGFADGAETSREQAEDEREKAEAARDEAEAHTAAHIAEWLAKHPEATTSVQDRSLTINKMVAGTLGYVTPEEFGAVGDGVTDDTKAFQDCVNAELPICARKTYFITDQIGCANKSLDLFGGGTFIVASQDKISALFYVSDQKGGEPVDRVMVKDMSFRSVRDNTTIFPPTGHTREEGCLASNVHCLMLANIKNVVLENLRFENMEYDVFFADCASINVRGHYSTGASMAYYGRGCGNFQIRDAKITLYDKVGVGDHHFYFGKNNGDVLIENVRLYSPTDKSGYYPIHFYSDEGYSAINATVRNSYIEHSNAICAICQNGIVVENTTFVNIIGGTKDGTFVYEATSNESITHRFKGCAFKSLNGKLNVINFTNKAVFADCVFEGADINLVLEAKANVSFERCGFAFNGRLYVYSDVRYTFTDCAFKMNNWCVFVESGRSPSCDFTRCSFEANSDGIFSVRGTSTVTLIGCNGTNANAAKKFNYDGSAATGTYKLYNCTFPDLTFRAGGATLIEKQTVWAG